MENSATLITRIDSLIPIRDNLIPIRDNVIPIRANVIPIGANLIPKGDGLIPIAIGVTFQLNGGKVHYESEITMNNLLLLWAPDAMGTSNSGAPAPTDVKRSYGPFDKKKAAALVEAAEVAQNAGRAPYAAILNDKYSITPVDVATLVTQINNCEGYFGSSRAGRLGSQGATVDKDEAREAIIEAIDEFRTGARLSLKSAAEMTTFGVGVDLEKNESVLALLAQTILDDARSPTLRGIGPDEMTALQTALAAWKTASGEQSGQGARGQGDRARALELFETVEDKVREIKIAIDGKFSFRKPENVDARKLFHLPPHRPFAPHMGERA